MGFGMRVRKKKAISNPLYMAEGFHVLTFAHSQTACYIHTYLRLLNMVYKIQSKGNRRGGIYMEK